MSALRRFVVMIAFSLLAGSAPAGSPLPFLELRYRARKALVLNGDVRLRAELRDTDAESGRLRDCAEGEALAPSSRRLVHLDATTKATFHGLSQELTWIDPGSGDVLQQVTARGRRWKLKRSTRDGHHQWTRRPAGRRERRGPVDAWSEQSEGHETWAEGVEATGPRTSSFALLWQAATLGLDAEGSRAELMASSRNRPLAVELVAGGLEPIDVVLRLRRGDGPVRERRGRVFARRVDVRGALLDDEGGDLGLFGMRSDVAIYLEPGTGLPLEVRGDVPGLGALRVRLVEARLPAGD